MALEKTSSLFNRKIVNLFAGMADGHPLLPPFLANAGYKTHSIERSFTVAPGRVVKAELILCSDQLQHSLLIEAKSGANLKPDQLARYAAITEKSLVESAFASKAAAKSHNVLFVGRRAFESRLLLSSSKHPSAARIICLTDGLSLEIEDDADAQGNLLSTPLLGTNSPDGLTKVENTFGPNKLEEQFQPTLVLDWKTVPINYLPLDHEAEDWEFAERLIPEFVINIQANRGSVSIDELGASIIGLWPFFLSTYKREMVSRLERVVKLAAQGKFSAYMAVGSNLAKRSVIFRTPDDLQGKPGHLRSSLHKQARLFLEELKSPQIAMVFEAD